MFKWSHDAVKLDNNSGELIRDLLDILSQEELFPVLWQIELVGTVKRAGVRNQMRHAMQDKKFKLILTEGDRQRRADVDSESEEMAE